MDQEKTQFLDEHVFCNLENQNNGFDSKLIKYFSTSDFEIVLSRIEKLGIGILGIESWLNGEFYDVRTPDDYNATSFDSRWYKNAFLEFKESDKEFLYSASYELPKK